MKKNMRIDEYRDYIKSLEGKVTKMVANSLTQTEKDMKSILTGTDCTYFSSFELRVVQKKLKNMALDACVVYSNSAITHYHNSPEMNQEAYELWTKLNSYIEEEISILRQANNQLKKMQKLIEHKQWLEATIN